VADD
jgi:hypothetical protein